ncbi:MAG: hypothetical protein P4L86_16910 [Mycobacterium sp.]|nr:hypothetical protein [Mycobacterium sp.]
MTAPDPATSVNQQFWGANYGDPPGGAPAGAADDAIVIYDGADRADFPWAKLPNGGWWAWDLRGSILTFTHDLLRFQKPTDHATDDPTKPVGLRDSVSRQHLLTEQNNFMLRKLCAGMHIDLTGMPGT